VIGASNPGSHIGHWIFQTIPQDWEIIEGRGLRRTGVDVSPSNAIATEDTLQGTMTLQEYLESQFPIVRHYFPDSQFEFRGPVKMKGVEETITLIIRFKGDDGQPAVQRQIYVRQGRQVGVLTFTTLEKELKGVDPSFAAILLGASFSAT